MLTPLILLLVQNGSPSLFRSYSSGLDTLPGQRFLAPEIRTVYNSALPFSLNDGALWAGRGFNGMVRAGVRARWGRFWLVLAPELLTSENTPYALPEPGVELPRPPGRNAYSTPWHVAAYSIDAPLRFGDLGYTRADFGQSTLGVDAGAFSVGLSSENEWWGPGIRNALVLSDNARGIWRGFARTRRPLRTGIGTLEARFFIGALFESRYFDNDPTNDRRSLAALAATWSPNGAPNLTLGFARAVYAPLAQWSDIAEHALDVVRGQRHTRDEVLSLFGRWAFPDDGLAVHFELARNQLPRSLRELLVSPNHSQGYTVGLEWGRATIHIEAEVTSLEKSPAYRNEPEETWYTSRGSPQGYTQGGQVIGAAIGPGASSQWLAVDHLSPAWRAGVFLGRIRWDNDALYLFPSTTEKRLSHDVSLFGGVRAQWRRFAATLTLGSRLNPFYRTNTTVGNTTLELRFTPP